MANNHDMGRVFMQVDGVALGGFGADVAVSIERNNPNASITVGCDGEATRNENRDQSYTVTITLMATSNSNDVLEIYRKISATLGGSGSRFSFGVRSLDNGNAFSSVDCFVMQEPTMEFGAEVSEFEWQISAPKGMPTFGGSLT